MRTASTAFLDAANNATVSPFFAAELMYPDGPVRVTSLPQNITHAGNVWYGTGVLGELSPLEEGNENRSYGFELTLSGIPGDWSAYLRGQDVQGGLVTIMLGFVNPETWSVLALETITVGRMDTQDVVSGETTAVKVVCEGPGVDWERPRVRRATNVDQQTRAPGDTFFRFAPAMRDFREEWGRSG